MKFVEPSRFTDPDAVAPRAEAECRWAAKVEAFPPDSPNLNHARYPRSKLILGQHKGSHQGCGRPDLSGNRRTQPLSGAETVRVMCLG
jgi:hypothetical protein